MKGVYLNERNPFSSESERKAIFCSVTTSQQNESLELIKQLTERGFEIFATPGTADAYQNVGIPVTKVDDDEAEVAAQISSGKLTAVFNIPTAGRNRQSFGFKIRALALRYQVPVYTCADTLEAALAATKVERSQQVHTLDDYRNLTYMTNKGK